MISFLDLVPAPKTATVKVNTATGPADVELTGVSLKALAEIAKRYPAFVRRLEGGTGSIIEQPEAMVALVAASLGYLGNRQYEAQLSAFPSADVMNLFQAALRLTFPQDDTPAPLPEPEPAMPEAVVVDGLDQTQPLQLSN
jgi:hypothetical protein